MEDGAIQTGAGAASLGIASETARPDNVSDRGGAFRARALLGSHVLFVFLACIFLTIAPIAMHFVSPKLAIAGQFALATGCAIFFPAVTPFVVVFSIFFQNVFASVFSGYMASMEDYNFVRGYNFLTMMVIWIWLFGQYALNWRSYSGYVNRLMAACIIGFCLIGVYLLLGMTKNPAGAIIYLRNIITPLVIFQIFLLVSLKHRLPMLQFYTVLTVILLVLGYIEMMDRRLWLDLTNGWTLWDVEHRRAILSLAADELAAKNGTVMRGVLDTMRVVLFNTPLFGDDSIIILRMKGPNLHPISYSYGLVFVSIIMLMNGRWYLLVPMIPLFVMASAKGALILMILAFCALLARKMFGAVFGMASLVVVLVIYVIFGIITGLKIGDFHVLGFMGGLYNFLAYPFGNGLGDAGNLVSDFSTFDWEAYQHAGRTPVAMESSVAVMLHQMGFATFGLLGIYFWIAAQTYKLSLHSRLNLHSVASFILVIVVVTGVFQEEAIFSPLALGLIISLNGYILGVAARSPRWADARA